MFSCITDPFYFPLQFNPAFFLHAQPHFLPQIFQIFRRGIAGIDEEVAMFFRHLRTADLQTSATGAFDQLPCFMACRVFKRAAAGA